MQKDILNMNLSRKIFEIENYNKYFHFFNIKNIESKFASKLRKIVRIFQMYILRSVK